MKLRDKILYMSFGAELVVLGMILNSLVSGDADAQEGVKDVEFGYITCKGLIIRTEDKVRGYFGLDSGGDAILEISDDGERPVAYLGKNTSKNDEMIFQLQSKSKKVSKNETAIKILGQNQGLDKKHPTDLSDPEWQIIKDEFTRRKKQVAQEDIRSERW